MARLQVEAHRSIYYEHYLGDRIPNVLLHGWGSTVRVWDCVVASLLARGHAVVTLDQRCHGQSDMDFEQMTVADLANDVVRLVEALKLERVVLNGWSMGGTVAVEAASMLGGRLAGLIMTCTLPRATEAPDWPWGMPAQDFEALAFRAETDRLGTFYEMARASFGGADAHQIDWCVRMKLESGPRAGALIRNLVAHDGRATAGSIRVPSLVVGGRLDRIVHPEACEAVATLLGSAGFVMIPGSGHTPMLEATEDYTAAVSAYLDRLERRGVV